MATSSIRITKITDLSNEILFDIFDYFWVTDLFHSFFLLFPDLLADRLLRLHVRLTSYTNEKHFMTSILPFIHAEQIISLSMTSLSSRFPIDRLINLESFSLERDSSNIYALSYEETFEKLSRLSKLKYLSAEFTVNDSGYRNNILRLIFEKLSLYRFDFWSRDSITNMLPSTLISSSIKYISLRGINNLSNLISVLRYLPNVRTIGLIGCTIKEDFVDDLVLPHVKQLFVSNCCIFLHDAFLRFIQNVLPNMIKLSFVGDFDEQNCLEQKTWDCLLQLQKRKRKLKEIKINIRYRLRDDTSMEKYVTNICLYDSKFRMESLQNGQVGLRAYFTI